MTTPKPAQLGYRMPAEWEPHTAIYLAWPHDRVSFPELEKVEQAYVEIIRAISPTEIVRLFVVDDAMHARAEALLTTAGIELARVNFFVQPYGDVWFRDYGPLFVVNRAERKLAMTHWIFNAWGGKYAELLGDTALPETINARLQLPYFPTGIVLEGGSIEQNGAGLALTTEQCLLNRNRNPNLTKTDIEKYLADYLGITKVLWLGRGIAGDDTDGHIDDLARFVNPTTVVCALEDDKANDNYAVLAENYARLQTFTDTAGQPLTVAPLPMPHRQRLGGGPLAASYTNFYIGNEVVLMPIFADPADAKAIEILTPLFPGRRIVPIHCYDLIHGNGTLHCISQQEPAV